MPAIFKKLFNRAGKSQVPMTQIPNLYSPSLGGKGDFLEI
jgi:hypothetical protein